ncbi:MAG: single-stranded-DNA-specific exonuclease RecJ [Anaerolineales bacterium]|nr:single-stranded-DNA-specific exonuclease RecJ [Anaerolineales bacterium]
MLTWTEPVQYPVSPELAQAVGGHPLVAQTLARRGLGEPAAALGFLDPAFYQPCSALELPDMDVALDRLLYAIQREETICVWGDFDVDGQTATTLLVSALRQVGGRVVYHIPVRASESHGISLQVLHRLIAQESPSLILTCDTGVSAHQAVAYANQCRVEVVITDHHELPAELPPALAVVNPRRLLRPGLPGHPLETLPGVGVAYKLVEALYERLARAEDLEQFLDLVALGIVADVAGLTGDTRYLLQRGLKVLQRAERLGLQIMMGLADLKPARCSEEHIGYLLGPRLNALGRLGDANSVVELLTTQDQERARQLAVELEGLNARRQLLTSQVYHSALALLEQDPGLLDYAALVLAHPAWPAGVIGIVASRLVERFRKPVVLVAAPPGEVGRASARSVDGLDITAAIASQAPLLEGFGGHSMAAGFAIQPEKIPEFRQGIARYVDGLGERPPATLIINDYLPLHELSLDLAAELERLAPYGAGNPPLVLASRAVRLQSYAPFGRNQEHLSVTVEDGLGRSQRLLWWQAGDELLKSETLEKLSAPDYIFDLAYTLRTSTYRGQRDLQVEWVDYRPSQPGIAAQLRPRIQVVDYRQQEHPMPVLSRLLSTEENLQVWAEGEALQKLSQAGLPGAGKFCARHELSPGRGLVIWTAPPSRGVMQEALERVSPQQVWLFSIDPHLDQPEAFITRLAGLVKFALQRQTGRVELERLAAAMAHRQGAVRKGLEWLEARGDIEINGEENNQVKLSAGDRRIQPELELVAQELDLLLEETAAFRAYFDRAEPEFMLS